MENACVTPLEDLKRDALIHYEEASSAIHHWCSVVPQAIKEYFDRRIRERDELKKPKYEVPEKYKDLKKGIEMGETEYIGVCFTYVDGSKVVFPFLTKKEKQFIEDRIKDGQTFLQDENGFKV